MELAITILRKSEVKRFAVICGTVRRLNKSIQVLRSNNKTAATYIFENVPIEWNGIKIERCNVVNISDVNGNYIGTELMQRFNFILAYGEHQNNKDLYIQPCKNFDSIEHKPIISPFGLGIGKREETIKIVRLEENGIAERAGITLGDDVLQIDSLDLNNENLDNEFIRYTQDKNKIRLKLKDKGEIMLTL